MSTLRSTMLILTVLILSVAILFSTMIWEAQATTKPPGPVAVYTGTDFNFAPAYIADAKGLFKKHGVGATVQAFDSGADAVDALRSAGTGYVLAGDLPSMKTWAKGDVVGISPLVWDDSSISILASKDIKSATDLRGKKIAVIVGSSDEILLTNYLRKRGLGRVDVEIINLSPGDMPVALARGEIVAFMGNQLTTSKGLQAVPGSHYLQQGTKGIGTNRIMVSALRTPAARYPNLTEGVLRALLEAIRNIHERPSESYEIVAKRLGTSTDKVRENTKVFNFSMTFDRAFIDDMTTKSSLAVQLGMMKQPIDWKTQFDTRFLRAIDKNLVTAKP